jgi:hypothetical protein
MSKRKTSRHSRSNRRPKAEGPSLVVVLSITSMALIGYLVGETVLALRPHPAHWGIAILGGFIGWAVGRIYYQIKGDII